MPASEALKTLFENFDKADKAYREFIDPILAENRALTEDEEVKRTELRSATDRVKARIAEQEEDEKREAEIAEARARILGDSTEDVATQVTVGREARTYGPGTGNSYIADFVRSTQPGWAGHAEACERLHRYAVEVEGEMRSGSKEGTRARRLLRQIHQQNESRSRSALEQVETRVGMTTGATSGGSFVTPYYEAVADYVPFRQPGRAFIDLTNKQPLPEFGMTVYLPAVNNAAGIAAQVGQNQGVTEIDPTAGYLSAGLTTMAGEVIVSQQLLDRAGPNFHYDVMVMDQLKRAYNQAVDLFVLQQALANAGSLSYTGSISVAGTYSKVGGAKAAIATASGVVMSPTHAFYDPARWEWLAAQVDSTGRALIVPNYAGAFNALGAGADGTPTFEGFTGYKFNGLPAVEDHSIPVPGSGSDQIVVAAMDEIYTWEGDLIPRVLPQTLASNLSVILQNYAYIAVIARYALAVQAISGSAFTTPTF